MSAEKCGTPITIEMIERATIKIAQQGHQLPDRIISPKANHLLKRIQQKEPGWDDWSVSGEIWWKAYKMGLLGDEE